MLTDEIINKGMLVFHWFMDTVTQPIKSKKARFQFHLQIASSKEEKLVLDSESFWTSQEKEKFWKIMKPYITNLLTDANIFRSDGNENFDFINSLDPLSTTDILHSRRIVRTFLWTGKYRAAIKSYRLFQEFFSIITNIEEKTLQEEIEELQSIFTNPYL